MRKTLALFAGIVLFSAPACTAKGARPDFTGRWVLDPAKSNLGGVEGGISRADIIEHTEPKLTQTITARVPQGEQSTTMTYTTDGEENTNMVADRPVKSTTRWEGTRLVTRLKADLRGGTVESKEVWELSADGKVLTITRDMTTPQSKATHKLVFNKQ